MNNSICTLFDNILIDIHKFKSLQMYKPIYEREKIFTQDFRIFHKKIAVTGFFQKTATANMKAKA